MQGDVGAAEDRAALLRRTLEEFGRLDVLVNNAGITSQGRKDILEATEESWDQVFDTNLKGPFFLAQLAANEMIRLDRRGQIAGGKIINISSISAYAVSTNRADYCMTKAAAEHDDPALRRAAGRGADQVFEVCPGVIASDMTAPVKEKYDRLIAEGLWPIRRWGTPEDVARAVAAIVLRLLPVQHGRAVQCGWRVSHPDVVKGSGLWSLGLGWGWQMAGRCGLGGIGGQWCCGGKGWEVRGLQPIWPRFWAGAGDVL